MPGSGLPTAQGATPTAADADLVVRLRAGDERAFADLVERWSPSMLRIARTFVGSTQSAEDAVQDAWLGVIRGLDHFEQRSSLRTWVFTILVNRARTRGAREGRTVPSSHLWADESGGPDGWGGATVDPARFQGPDGEYPGHWTSAGAPQPWHASPERRALATEALTMLGRAMQDLPARQRLIVTLRDVEHWTVEEACQALEITPENQRVLLHRGRAALRRALEDYYHG